MIRDAGLRPSTQFQDVDDPAQDGIVLDQDPSGNEQASPGSTVIILVGRFVEP
jgi:beta-lactam-binding protein with PASTA domain